MKTLAYYSILMGCDPEFFFSKDGNIVGSEKILPKDGLKTTNNVIIDGVQGELNPLPSSCRESLAYNISQCFISLCAEIQKKNNDIKVDFSEVVKVDKKELKSLSKKTRVFGCAESRNFYTNSKSEIKVNPSTYLFRSAGGHIHIGSPYAPNICGVYIQNLLVRNIEVNDSYGNTYKGEGLSLHKLKEKLEVPNVIQEYLKIKGKNLTLYLDNVSKALVDYKKLIPLLDIIVGNTCVLIDKNPMAKERRNIYGRAGEYRLPPYGIEYRTLSNFWLKSYPLMSLVFGLTRLATNILVNSFSNEEFYTIIMNSVKKEDIEKAINENDFDLAYKNFLQIEKPLMEMTSPTNNICFSLNPSNIDYFHKFIKKDINYWFKQEPLQHWVDFKDMNLRRGGERFLSEVVALNNI